MNKRMKASYALVTSDVAMSVSDAIAKLHSFPAPKFTQSVDLAIQISNRPVKDKDLIKGFTVLPYGVGKNLKIAIFAGDSEQVIGADKITPTDIEAPDFKVRMSQYQKCGATTLGLPAAIKAAAVIGPMGLMPTAKNNTVMSDPVLLIDFLRNAVIFAEKSKHIMIPAGNTAMPSEHLVSNINAILEKIFAMIPKEKRSILGRIYISATMSPAIPIQYP